MKKNALLKSLLIVSIMMGVCSTSLAQKLVVGWDFQTTKNGGEQIAGGPNTQTVFIANFGSGTLYLDGTNGSSAFRPAYWEIIPSATVNMNGGDGFSTDVNQGSLCIGKESSNGKSMVFKFPMTKFKKLAISYACFRPTATAFHSNKWEWSTDGENWNEIEVKDLSFLNYENGKGSAVIKVPSSDYLSVLDNAPAAYLRLTIDGASASDNKSSIRLDNIKFNATPISK